MLWYKLYGEIDIQLVANMHPAFKLEKWRFKWQSTFQLILIEYLLCTRSYFKSWEYITHRIKSFSSRNFLSSFFFFFSFLGYTCGIQKFPGQGLDWSYSCQPTPRPQQCWIQAASMTYTTAHGNARSLTHWMRQGIEPASSWIPVRFLTWWATTETQEIFLLVHFLNLNSIYSWSWIIPFGVCPGHSRVLGSIPGL